MKLSKNISRRSFVKTATSMGIGALALPELAAAQQAAPAAGTPCNLGFDLATYTVQDQKVKTQAQPGTMASVASEHTITANYYRAESYVVGQTTKETRHLLCVDVGSLPGMGVYHPVESGSFATRNSITDIYVFSQSNNQLLFWRKLGPMDIAPYAIFIVPPALVQAAPRLTIVARCSAHGYWGVDFDLSASALVDYASSGVVGANDASKLFSGSSLMRPYLAPGANGGQGDLTVVHRPNIILMTDGRVQAFMGGPLDGSGKHGKAESHHIAGGMLFDQNSNILGKMETIVYSQAANGIVTFSGFDLGKENVKTLRVVLFDTLNGLLMSFLDV